MMVFGFGEVFFVVFFVVFLFDLDLDLDLDLVRDDDDCIGCVDCLRVTTIMCISVV